MFAPAVMDAADFVKPPFFGMKSASGTQRLVGVQLFIAITRPSGDRDIERRRFARYSPVCVNRGKLQIGCLFILKIKLAHKLAFHQVRKLIRQSFQALFVRPRQQVKFITQRKKKRRERTLGGIAR
jgi:hypothetical protein